ncbi:MAG: hypothetical protein IKL47_03925 [Clostridia bacterium]|nr:hypothetical protein [Clostridia bacterium]
MKKSIENSKMVVARQTKKENSMLFLDDIKKIDYDFPVCLYIPYMIC